MLCGVAWHCVISPSCFRFFYLTIYVFFAFIVVMSRYTNGADEVRIKKVRRALVQNRGSFGSAMRSAGYSPAYASNPGQFIATRAGQQLLGWIDEETVRIQKAMRRKRSSARYRELGEVLCNLQKLGRLHRGETTESVGVSLASALKDLDKDGV